MLKKYFLKFKNARYARNLFEFKEKKWEKSLWYSSEFSYIYQRPKQITSYLAPNHITLMQNETQYIFASFPSR